MRCTKCGRYTEARFAPKGAFLCMCESTAPATTTAPAPTALDTAFTAAIDAVVDLATALASWAGLAFGVAVAPEMSIKMEYAWQRCRVLATMASMSDATLLNHAETAKTLTANMVVECADRYGTANTGRVMSATMRAVAKLMRRELGYKFLSDTTREEILNRIIKRRWQNGQWVRALIGAVPVAERNTEFGRRCYYVWRMTRYEAAVDCTMPITAECLCERDAAREELGWMARDAAKELYGAWGGKSKLQRELGL